MKCPKCGYNSFEYLDQCKKCGDDLSSVKQRCGIKAMLQPRPPSEEDTGAAKKEVIPEPALPIAPKPAAAPSIPKPNDLFDLGVFSTPAFGPVASETETAEIVVDGTTFPPPAAWSQPEVLGRREEDFAKPGDDPLLLEEMLPVEEVTAAEEKPPLVVYPDEKHPVLSEQPKESQAPTVSS